jgi:hypothetical protein
MYAVADDCDARCQRPNTNKLTNNQQQPRHSGRFESSTPQVKSSATTECEVQCDFVLGILDPCRQGFILQGNPSLSQLTYQTQSISHPRCPEVPVPSCAVLQSGDLRKRAYCTHARPLTRTRHLVCGGELVGVQRMHNETKQRNTQIQPDTICCPLRTRDGNPLDRRDGHELFGIQ